MAIENVEEILPTVAFRANGASNKLSFRERCSILAAYRRGIRMEVLAAAFGINRGTVGYIVRESSIHYRDVRKRAKEIGEKEFDAEYFDYHVVERIKKAATDPIVNKTVREASKEAKQRIEKKVDTGAPNKRSNSHAGYHKDHGITIEWLDSDYAKCETWVIFEDGQDDHVCFDDADNLFATSKAAYNYALNNKVKK